MTKRIITAEEIKKINDLNESVIGTPEYNKYELCHEFKYKENDKWTRWIYVGWANHIYRKNLTVKKVKDKVYLVTDTFTELGEDTVDRYEVPKTLIEVLGL